MLTQHSASAFEQIAPSIFRVELQSSTIATALAATGFAVARLQNSDRLVLATAGHVVKQARSHACDWTIQQFDRDGTPSREIRFKSQPDDSQVWLHKKLDLGILILDSNGINGSLFSPKDELIPLLIDEGRGVTAGTRVGWGGYPLIIEQTLGHPQLCYCEGVIAAMIDQAQRRFYIVDGHNTYGISGGPVWHWSDELDRLEVVGVVSNYQQVGTLPGFCGFAPLDSLRDLFKSWQDEWNRQNPTDIGGTE